MANMILRPTKHSRCRTVPAPNGQPGRGEGNYASAHWGYRLARAGADPARQRRKELTQAADVSGVVTDSLGIQDEAQAPADLADSAIAEELQTRLTEIALDVYKAQVQAYRQQPQNDFDKLTAFLADIQGARSLTTTVADKGTPTGWDASVVSVIGVGSLTVLGMAILGGTHPESRVAPMRRVFSPSVNSVTFSID